MSHFDSVNSLSMTTGSLPDVHSFEPKASVATDSVKQPSGFMPATDDRPGRMVKPVAAQESWLTSTAKWAWEALTSVSLPDFFDIAPDVDISDCFEGFVSNTSVSVVEPQLHLKKSRPEAASSTSTVIKEQKPDKSVAAAEKKRTSGIPRKISGHQFTKKSGNISLTRPDRGQTGIPMPRHQKATPEQKEVKIAVSKNSLPKKQVAQKQAPKKESIFAFNTVKRGDYYLYGDLPAAETIRKLNEHAREAKLRTPKELAEKPQVKEIDQKLYQRLQGKRRSKVDPAPSVETTAKPGKKAFRGNLEKLMKPLQGHNVAKEKFVSNAERVASFPKTLRPLK